MTSAQWLFEYVALREKEKDNTETIIQTLKALRKLLVSILGLNLMQKKKGAEGEDSKDKDEEDESFVPMSLIAGRREIVEHILENMSQEEAVQNFVEDEDFEKMSAAIAAGEDLGDMAPMFEVDDTLTQKLNTWFTPGREEELRKLGVRIVEEKTSDVSHVDVDAEAIKEKKIQRAMAMQQAKQDIEKQQEEAKKQLTSRGVKVTFEDG